MPASSLPGTARTTRNRKLECGCGYVVRASRTMIRRGLPTCVCGERLVPATLEDAILAHECGHLSDAELDAHPEMSEYVAALNSVAHGQAGPGRAMRACGKTFRAPEDIAYHRVCKARAASAFAARLAALGAAPLWRSPVHRSDPVLGALTLCQRAFPARAAGVPAACSRMTTRTASNASRRFARRSRTSRWTKRRPCSHPPGPSCRDRPRWEPEMSYYVRRLRDNRTGYIGPIRSPRRAERERTAWVEAGWTAEVLESTPETRAEVRAWERAKLAESRA